MLLERLRPKTQTRDNPVFYAEHLRRLVGQERLDRMLHDPDSIELLTWNVFSSLDTDDDREYLASLLEPLAGAEVRAPLHIALWMGRDREPLLHPSPSYVRHLRERVGDSSVEEFLRPIEVPVRISAPGLLILVDTTLDGLPRGAGGRDRLVELVDAGAEHARRLMKALTITVVYRSGTPAAAELSASVNRMRDPAALAAALPWHDTLPAVRFREMSWQQLLRLWAQERDKLRLFGQPTRQFLAYCEALGLR